MCEEVVCEEVVCVRVREGGDLCEEVVLCVSEAVCEGGDVCEGEGDWCCNEEVRYHSYRKSSTLYTNHYHLQMDVAGGTTNFRRRILSFDINPLDNR